VIFVFVRRLFGHPVIPAASGPCRFPSFGTLPRMYLAGLQPRQMFRLHALDAWRSASWSMGTPSSCIENIVTHSEAGAPSPHGEAGAQGLGRRGITFTIYRWTISLWRLFIRWVLHGGSFPAAIFKTNFRRARGLAGLVSASFH